MGGHHGLSCHQCLDGCAIHVPCRGFGNLHESARRALILQIVRRLSASPSANIQTAFVNVRFCLRVGGEHDVHSSSALNYPTKKPPLIQGVWYRKGDPRLVRQKTRCVTLCIVICRADGCLWARSIDVRISRVQCVDFRHFEALCTQELSDW